MLPESMELDPGETSLSLLDECQECRDADRVHQAQARKWTSGIDPAFLKGGGEEVQVTQTLLWLRLISKPNKNVPFIPQAPNTNSHGKDIS